MKVCQIPNFLSASGLNLHCVRPPCVDTEFISPSNLILMVTVPPDFGGDYLAIRSLSDEYVISSNGILYYRIPVCPYFSGFVY